MKSKALLLSLLSLLLLSPLMAQKIPIFNGKDLSGWHVDVPDQDENPNISPSFVVKDGLLISMGTPQGHLITNDEYENYRITAEYRFPEATGNCGILIHASTPRSLYKMFPKSIEVQMYHENAGDFWCIVENIEVDNMVERRGPKEEWGVTEGKKRRILNLTDGSENTPGLWNRMVIECLEDKVKVWVNGDLVNEGYNATATKGQVAVQAEGAKVEFRKLELEPITQLSK
ncbi:DUF1080 domain-containing protein [Cyclobacterium sp. 1_MG-2023]|uniref:3-keto-disaccharide hydrolase n=1 Tax=Cyclobacterium sp. 1_MG-2023 TaxID=3062681 RepID=UPI0026E1609C|nr:DUF1080 domain-containing protein [Cyclobacterium sp. 1_MG-2023]MDO6438403.1 DUF1080 domain-containing protein [Cyclobacterium sp. 1_MG-2023]